VPVLTAIRTFGGEQQRSLLKTAGSLHAVLKFRPSQKFEEQSVLRGLIGQRQVDLLRMFC
jgi:hypothetical protein